MQLLPPDSYSELRRRVAEKAPAAALALVFLNSSVVERMAVNHQAVGSNPTWGV